MGYPVRSPGKEASQHVADSVENIDEQPWEMQCPQPTTPLPLVADVVADEDPEPLDGVDQTDFGPDRQSQPQENLSVIPGSSSASDVALDQIGHLLGLLLELLRKALCGRNKLGLYVVPSFASTWCSG